MADVLKYLQEADKNCLLTVLSQKEKFKPFFLQLSPPQQQELTLHMTRNSRFFIENLVTLFNTYGAGFIDKNQNTILHLAVLMFLQDQKNVLDQMIQSTHFATAARTANLSGKTPADLLNDYIQENATTSSNQDTHKKQFIEAAQNRLNLFKVVTRNDQHAPDTSLYLSP